MFIVLLIASVCYLFGSTERQHEILQDLFGKINETVLWKRCGAWHTLLKF